MDNRYNRHNRRKYSLKVHIVLVIKYRKQLLKGSISDDVKQKIFDIANTRGYEIIAMETDSTTKKPRAGNDAGISFLKCPNGLYSVFV